MVSVINDYDKMVDLDINEPLFLYKGTIDFDKAYSKSNHNIDQISNLVYTQTVDTAADDWDEMSNNYYNKQNEIVRLLDVALEPVIVG